MKLISIAKVAVLCLVLNVLSFSATAANNIETVGVERIIKAQEGPILPIIQQELYDGNVIFEGTGTAKVILSDFVKTHMKSASGETTIRFDLNKIPVGTFVLMTTLITKTVAIK